jgi:hypothetical protein
MVTRGIQIDMVIYNTLLNGLCKAGKVVSCDTMDGVLLPSNDMTIDGVIHGQEVQMTASVMRLTHN